MVTVKRGAVLVGFAIALAAGPLAVASPAAAETTCPWGTKPTRFEGVCISGGGGGAAAPLPPIPPPSNAGPHIVNNPNGFDSVNGIPCSPEHYGTCYGMSQNPG
ncbi:hypothetical protein [Mycobacterium sp. 1274761.0]|uniref:hypothetical protein n=1 Tax=Mycobacterium sp. 1274761.0 TaxID=1834077 RepID=UPI0007FFF1AF|nr:hypothetical protein [Mycobacterium sp. 1274761.0]OBK71887.1 hypothetical protein A5651_17980 [Mycobacterium sp. 1274761.0]